MAAGDRKVRLIIEVDDKDVKATEASLHRLGVATKKVGDGGADVDKFSGSMTKASFTGNLLADVVQRLPELALRAGKAVFDLAANFGEYGMRIERARQLTGFGVDMLSALESQTHKTGTQFDQLGEGLKIYTKLIGDANHGSDNALAKMKRLGIEPVKAAQDLDTAFRDVLKRIVSLPNEVQQANAAMDAFGEQGYKLLPFFKSFNGDIDALVKKAREMGVVLSEDDVRAAKEFDEALKEVQERARGVGITFGRELADPVKRALDGINGWLQTNKGEIKAWAESTSDVLSGLTSYWTKLWNAVGNGGATLPPENGVQAFLQRHPITGVLMPHLAIPYDILTAEGKRQRTQVQGNYFTESDDPYAIAAIRNRTPAPWYGGAEEEKKKKARSGGGGGRATVPDGGERAMRQFFAEELGFSVNRTFGREINPGSFHPQGKAIDVAHQGVSQDELVRRIALAIEKGYQFVDERIKRPGIKQTGPHLHFEKDPNDPSSFLPASFYGGADRLAYLQAIDRKRLGKGGGTAGPLGEDIGKFLESQSYALTKADREKHLRRIIDVYKRLDIIPTGETLEKIHKAMLGEAEKLGLSTFGMSLERTQKSFDWGQMVPDSVPSSGIISTDITNRRLPLTQVEKMRQGMGLDSTFDDDGNLVQGSRRVELLNRIGMREAEIAARLEDQEVSRKEQVYDLGIQLELLQKGNIVEDANLRALEDKVLISREIATLENRIMNAGQNDQLVIEAAHLRDILDMRNRERDAVIATNRAQLELSQAMEISNKQIRAGVYEHMAAQKTLNQGIVDGINGTYDAILGRMNEPLDKLNEKSKGLLSFITEPLKAMQANRLSGMFTGIVDKIFPGMGSEMEKAKNPVVGELKDHTKLLEQIARNTGGLPTGYKPTAGGTFGSILGGGGFGLPGFGGGMGPGGTPNFNPNVMPMTGYNVATGQQATQSQQGGMGGFGGMFNPQMNPFTGKMNSSFAGKLGGIGGLMSMAGGFVPGRMGGVLQYAGMGMQIGSMFGPWGAAIGAGVGALVGFFTGKKDDAEKKLKEAAISQFGIRIKDGSIVKALKALGEGMFGKGKVGANAVAVVRSEEGQNILRAYAESSGQSGLKIDRLNYGDPNWSGNQFGTQFGGFRANGGSVFAGRGYVVGERRPELFVPSVNGTIMPAVPSTTTTSGVDKQLIASLSEAVYELAEEVRQFKTMPPGALVKAGLEENPAAAADAVEFEYQNNYARAERHSRNTGNAT